MSDTKIQWHPGFVAAANLEFRENKNDLSFEKEHNLNTRPLEIDLLVIKKNKDAHIVNEIGRIFKGHNVMEYKGPGDSLDIDDFHKSIAYACLYKSYGQAVDAIRADDVTFSLFREARPDGLFSSLKKYGHMVSNPYKGVYYVCGNIPFPAQVVVMRELSRDAHVWLSSLSSNLDTIDMERLTAAAKPLVEKDELEFVDSVMAVSMKANMDTVAKMRGGDSVYESVYEVLKPVIDPILKEIAEEKAKEMAEEKSRIWANKMATEMAANMVAEKDKELAEKNSALAERDAQIAMLTEQLRQMRKMANA